MNKYTQDQKDQAIQMIVASVNTGVKAGLEALNIPEVVFNFGARK